MPLPTSISCWVAFLYYFLPLEGLLSYKVYLFWISLMLPTLLRTLEVILVSSLEIVNCLSFSFEINEEAKLRVIQLIIHQRGLPSFSRTFCV